MPCVSAVIRANGLNVDPACIVDWVAALNGWVIEFGPPYIATTAPLPGLIETSPTRTPLASRSVGILSLIACTAAAWSCLLNVVTIRRPPRSSRRRRA